MTRKEWLDSLKPGDIVACKVYLNIIWSRYYYSFTYELYEIKSVSKHKVILSNGVKLSKKGQLDEYTGLGMNAFYCIEPVTYEIRQHIQDVEEYLMLRTNTLKELDDLYTEIAEGDIDLPSLDKLSTFLKDFRIFNVMK